MSGLTWEAFGDLHVPTRTQGGGALFPLGSGEACLPEVERGIWKVLRAADGPVTVQQLVDWFADQGLSVRDETIRAELRHMVMDHLLPICTTSEGVRLARNASDIRSARQHLVSRIERIQERIDALDEVERVYVKRDVSPIARRWSDQGVPKMMLGLVMGRHTKRRRRVKALADANARKSQTRIEAAA